MIQVSLIQLILIIFLTVFVGVGAWGLIIGGGKDQAKKPSGQPRLRGNVIYRDTLPCMGADEYFSVEIRQGENGRCFLVILHDDHLYAMVALVVVTSWAELMLANTGVDTDA